jgi:hypothetical protein
MKYFLMNFGLDTPRKKYAGLLDHRGFLYNSSLFLTPVNVAHAEEHRRVTD